MVSDSIDKEDLNRALKLIHDFVEIVVTNPLCTSRVFASKTLDELCVRIGKVNFIAVRRDMLGTIPKKEEGPVFVYVVTRLQKSGGHTRVIENFVKAQKTVKHVILLTELEGKSDISYLDKALSKGNNVIYEQAPRGSYQQKLTWLQRNLVELSPKRIYLFNHHQDSVATAAIQPEMGGDAYFYHHGDHHLCLGVYLSHLKHIDPHPMGYHNCRDELSIENIYIPLVVADAGKRSENIPFLEGEGLITCTAARSNKVEIPYFISYLELVPKLLKLTGGTHIHIGRLTPWALYKIRRGLKKQNIQPEKFIYVPWVPSVWSALHKYRVDLYITSFPYGGGLTLIEVMGAGIPIALHQHIFSRILSGVELAYPNVFSWRYPEELFNYCQSVVADDLSRAGKSARMQFERFHLCDYLCHILDNPEKNTLKPNSLALNFFIEVDEWALWMEQQLSFRRLVANAIYRFLRRIASRFR